MFIAFAILTLSGCSPRIRHFYGVPQDPFFMKMAGVTGNHNVCYIYVEKPTIENEISVVFDLRSNDQPYDFFGFIDYDGKLVLKRWENQREIIITGEFKDHSTLVLDTRNWNKFKKDKIEFKEFEKLYKIIPKSFYLENKYVEKNPEKLGNSCDTFTSFYRIKDYSFEGAFPYNFEHVVDSIVLNGLFYEGSTPVETEHGVEEVYPQTLEITQNIMFFEQGFVSLRIVYDFFECGAAHNVYQVYYINYDSDKQKIIKLRDIYPRQIIYEIREICKRKMKLEFDKSDDELVDFDLPKNYAFLKNGILFQFQPYEFGPFSEGPKSIFITYSEIPKMQ